MDLLPSIQRFSASLDLASPEAALSSLGLSAEDVEWISRESSAPTFFLEGRFFGTVGRLIYASARTERPAELIFLIGDEGALPITQAALREAFGEFERNESRKKPAGALIFRTAPMNIIFTSKDISRDDLELDAIFFRAAQPTG